MIVKEINTFRQIYSFVEAKEQVRLGNEGEREREREYIFEEKGAEVKGRERGESTNPQSLSQPPG